jgi:uncharacterized delta-60 repeat protein
MPSYSGVWTLTAQYQAIGADNWPTSTYWIATLGGNGATDAYGNKVALDSSGNVYVVGYGRTTNSLLVIAKYSNKGNLQWQKTLDASDTDQGYDITVDSSGNIYVSGFTNAATVLYELLVVKYNSSGTIQWQKTLSGASGSYDAGVSIKTDTSGNVYVFGYTGASNVEQFLAVKYNSAGTVQWQRSLGGATSDYGQGVAVDSSANVYVVGATDVSGNYDIQLAKYDTSGTIQWQRKLTGSGSAQDLGYAIAVDSSSNVYICGVSNSGIGTNDIQLAKYDTSGTIQWQRRLGSTGGDEYGRSIAVDSSANVYICGETGAGRIQIAKYDTSGTLQWQRDLYNNSSNAGNGITVDNLGNFYIVGVSYYGSNVGFITAKLPTDGTMTGTYGGYTYAVSTLTSATTTLTAATSTLTTGTPSLTSATSTLTPGTGSFTPNRISV